MPNLLPSNSTLERLSRYVQGGQSEVGKIGLEWWDRYSFPLDGSDLIYTVELKFVNRIDLIANAFYGEPRYWWFIAQYNNVLDPWAEIFLGRNLRIATLDRLNNLFTKQPGAIASTRLNDLVLPPIVL